MHRNQRLYYHHPNLSQTQKAQFRVIRRTLDLLGHIHDHDLRLIHEVPVVGHPGRTQALALRHVPMKVAVFRHLERGHARE